MKTPTRLMKKRILILKLKSDRVYISERTLMSPFVVSTVVIDATIDILCK